MEIAVITEVAVHTHTSHIRVSWLSCTPLSKHPACRLLHVDKQCQWEELMGIAAQTGGLTRVAKGTITAPRTFIADHADGGTVRVTLQVRGCA
jgi:hypothetical protein